MSNELVKRFLKIFEKEHGYFISEPNEPDERFEERRKRHYELFRAETKEERQRINYDFYEKEINEYFLSQAEDAASNEFYNYWEQEVEEYED